MANGKIRFGKQSGGELALVFPDGVANTEVTFPESGILATKQYVDDSSEPTFLANDSRVKTALNASGTAPIYACRAWVNFNGTGTVSIRGSGNVSSITDNGVGDYTLNFVTAMPDANYSYAGSAQTDIAGSRTNVIGEKYATNRTTSTLRIGTGWSGSGSADGLLRDSPSIDVIVFR